MWQPMKNRKFFKEEFVPIWESKGFKILTFQNYKHLLPVEMDPKWIPLIETVICSNGRLFVGTHFSTFTSYVHRMRGHFQHIKNKNFYFTDIKYNNVEDHQDFGYYAWDREFPRSFVVDDNDSEPPAS